MAKDSSFVTVFGLVAEKSPSALRDRSLTHVFKGPIQHAEGGTCWLDAVLGLGLALTPLTAWPSHVAQLAADVKEEYEDSLLRALSRLYARWGDQSSIAFRKDLSLAYKQVWTQFEEKGGFEFGLAHSVVDAFLFLLQETHHWLSLVMPASALWAIVPVANSDEIREYLAREQTEPVAFVVFVNPMCFAIPEDLRQHGDSVLHAWIAFEEIGMIGETEINHFTCVGLEPQRQGYTIYDDLLTIAPGGWQGGFVPAEDECYESNMKDFTQRVPIAVYRRGDSPTSSPCSTKDESQKSVGGPRQSERLRKMRLADLSQD